MNLKEKCRAYYKTLLETIEHLNYSEIERAMQAIKEAYERDAVIYICGNGGSAATASHFTNDFNKGLSESLQKPFRFYCLNDNTATLMAIANDISYEEVFSFQLRGRITSNDLLIAISGSGNSKNIIRACETARLNGCRIIGISGYQGGALYEMSDYHMHVELCDMQIVEDIHMTFDHMTMKVLRELWDETTDKNC